MYIIEKILVIKKLDSFWKSSVIFIFTTFLQSFIPKDSNSSSTIKLYWIKMQMFENLLFYSSIQQFYPFYPLYAVIHRICIYKLHINICKISNITFYVVKSFKKFIVCKQNKVIIIMQLFFYHEIMNNN